MALLYVIALLVANSREKKKLCFFVLYLHPVLTQPVLPPSDKVEALTPTSLAFSLKGNIRRFKESNTI